MSAVRGAEDFVPPRPADAPSARELISESALLTPFKLHDMPMTRTDAVTCRALAVKLSAAEVHWIMLIMLEFFRHGQRDFIRSRGIEPQPEPGSPGGWIRRPESDSVAAEHAIDNTEG